jgi:hypothetical protein
MELLSYRPQKNRLEHPELLSYRVVSIISVNALPYVYDDLGLVLTHASSVISDSSLQTDAG